MGWKYYIINVSNTCFIYIYKRLWIQISIVHLWLLQQLKDSGSETIVRMLHN